MRGSCLAFTALAALALASAQGPALAQTAPAPKTAEEEQKEIGWAEAREKFRDYFRESGKRYRIRVMRREGDNYVARVYDTRGLPKGRYALNALTGEISRLSRR